MHLKVQVVRRTPQPQLSLETHHRNHQEMVTHRQNQKRTVTNRHRHNQVRTVTNRHRQNQIRTVRHRHRHHQEVKNENNQNKKDKLRKLGYFIDVEYANMELLIIFILSTGKVIIKTIFNEVCIELLEKKIEFVTL